MLFKKWILSFFLLTSISAIQAATVAIIDSGVDMGHTDIASNAWRNPLEIPSNNRDEDHNGYQDDIYGWNFAENNAQVIDYKYLGTFSPDPYKFFEIQRKLFFGTASAAEIKWVKAKRNDAKFIQEIQKFGNFVHGTHVAGITVKNSEEAKVLAVKLIPTEIKLPFTHPQEYYSRLDKDFRIELLKMGLAALAKQQAKLLTEIGAYIKGHKVKVANGSFGTSITQARMIITPLFKLIMGQDGSENEIKDIAIFFLRTLVKESAGMTSEARDVLFVFAAGNDNNNNDIIPTSPANIDSNNVISVAATFGRDKLATFSSYGVESVDVAAPGVVIKSSIPGDEWLHLSGTSQAAPYVAGVAAAIREINPKLLLDEVKRIIMKTVDIKEVLKSKVTAGGVVNPPRAEMAAQLSLNMPLAQAIKQSRVEISDIINEQIDYFMQSTHQQEFAKETILPLATGFKL